MKKKILGLILAVITCSFVASILLEESEGELFESIQPGESEESVYEKLGTPTEINETPDHKDLRYWITYEGNEGYSLLGSSMGLPRIIRIKDGLVASKGRNEDYYDPYKPGWVPIDN